MALVVDYNDLTVGVNEVQGERADTFRRDLESMFNETIEDYGYVYNLSIEDIEKLGL